MTHLLHRGVYKFLSIGACKSALWNVLVTLIMNKKAPATDLMLQKTDISLLFPQNPHSHCCLWKQHHITPICMDYPQCNMDCGKKKARLHSEICS